MGIENPRQRQQRIEAWQSSDRPFAAPHCYASGEEPMRGDVVEYAEKLRQPIPASREHDELWIVTTPCGDMVRCKCDGAENWRQAHYVARLRLVRRKKRNDESSNRPPK